MVQQVLGKRDIGGKLGNALGSSFAEGAKEANQYALNRSRLDEALSNFENIPNIEQLPFSQQVTAAARALLPAPGGSQVLSELLPFLQKNAKVAAQNKTLGGQGEGGATGQQRLTGQLPNFMDRPGSKPGAPPQKNPNYPDVQRAETDYTTVPGKSTGPQPVPIKSGEELSEAALQTQQRSMGTANPMSYEDALNIEVQKNNANQAYNYQLKTEQDANKIRQQEINQSVDAAVEKIYPQATEEELALFNQWGNEAAESSEKESDRRNYVARKVRDYKTNVDNIKSHVSRPNWFNNIYNSLRGNSRSREQAADELKSLVQPLLDVGMVDKVRDLLAGLDWMPIEIEEIISPPLSPSILNQVNRVPKFSREMQTGRMAGVGGPPVIGTFPKNIRTDEVIQRGIDATSNSLSEIFKENRDANLILLRDAFEKRGIPWDEFSVAFQKFLQTNPDFKPNSDQQKQLKNLSEPPLSGLDRFFYNIGVKGK